MRYMTRADSVALGCVAVGLVARLAAAATLGDSVEPLPAIFDQISYHALALRAISGHFFTFPVMWWPVTAANAPTAHWSYLYTLYLAGLYALFGAHPVIPRLIQAAFAGLLLPWLTYRIAVRVFPDSLTTEVGSGGEGLLAAAWVAAYGYFIYYAAALMTETFYIIGILWSLDCALKIAGATIQRAGFQTAIRNPQSKIGNWIELGFAIAVTAYLRQVFLLFVPFLFAWLFWVGASRGHRLLIIGYKLLITLIVLFILIAPASIYNYRQFGRFVLLNTNAGYALFWANHPIYGDQFVPILTADMPSYQDLIPDELRSLNEAELDNALLQRALGFIAADPLRYLRLSLSRIPAYFNFWPLMESSALSNIVRVGSFGLALPFMLFGVGLWIADGLRREPTGGFRSPSGLLLLFALVYSSIHLLSWSLIRYRLPVDAVMLVFAARGLVAVSKRLPGTRSLIQWLFPVKAIDQPTSHTRMLD